MKIYLMFGGILVIFSTITFLIETSLVTGKYSTTNNNNLNHLLSQQQQQQQPQQRRTSANNKNDNDRCGNPSGNDVCIVGNFDGRNFNRIISMAHAFHELSRLQNFNTNNNNNNNNGGGGVVRLTPKGMKWYHEWFDDDPTKVQLITEKCRPKLCKVENTWMNFFYWTHTAKTSKDKQGLVQGKQFALSTTIAKLLRKDYMDKAHQQIEKYRKLGGGDGDGNNVKVVTVHARWIEGTCPHKAKTGQNACEQQPEQPTTNTTTMIPSAWIKACEYTEDYVRANLPDDIITFGSDNKKNEVVIVLLGDGQNEEAESTFHIRDTNNFQIQSLMMILSDYHFGNPQSSADAIIAHWRSGHHPDGKKETFPEDCF